MPKQSKSKSPENAADMDAAVRTRAYHLWEADGRPDGRADHYWHQAKAEASPAVPKRTRAAKASAPAAKKKPRKKAQA